MPLQHITVARVYFVSLINFHDAYNSAAYSAPESLPSLTSVPRSPLFRAFPGSSSCRSFSSSRDFPRGGKIGGKNIHRAILLFSSRLLLPCSSSCLPFNPVAQFHRKINYTGTIASSKYQPKPFSSLASRILQLFKPLNTNWQFESSFNLLLGQVRVVSALAKTFRTINSRVSVLSFRTSGCTEDLNYRIQSEIGRAHV